VYVELTSPWLSVPNVHFTATDPRPLVKLSHPSCPMGQGGYETTTKLFGVTPDPPLLWRRPTNRRKPSVVGETVARLTSGIAIAATDRVVGHTLPFREDLPPATTRDGLESAAVVNIKARLEAKKNRYDEFLHWDTSREG
jgi:hypothetical protein